MKIARLTFSFNQGQTNIISRFYNVLTAAKKHIYTRTEGRGANALEEE